MSKHTFIRATATGLVTAGLLAFPALAAEKSEIRDVPTFSKIDMRGQADLIITAGEKQSVTLFGDEKKLARIDATVEGDTLVIKQKGRNWIGSSVDVTITVAKLEEVSIEGAADVTLKKMKADNFKLFIAGAGDVDIEGTCNSSDMTISGAGDIDAHNFKCKSVDVQINGAGDADVYASESINATVNGVGDVKVYGNPKTVRPRINGIGSFDIVDK